ncbi:MAG: EamA family transporter [Chloroherpetonaceae bacterium]
MVLFFPTFNLTALSKRLIAESFLLLTATIWGTTFVATKVALEHVSPLLYLAVRFSVASVLFVMFFRKSFPIPKSLLLSALPLLCWYFAGFVFQTVGLNFTTASKSGLITGSYVIFTPILQSLLEKRTPPFGIWIASAMVFGGLFLLTMNGAELVSDFNIGDALTLLCGLCYAFYLVELDKLTSQSDFNGDGARLMQLVLLQLLFCGLVSVPFSFLLEIPKLHLSWNLVIVILYLALFASVLTTILQTRYQKDTTPSRAAIIFIMEAVVSTLFAVFFFGESLSTAAWIGAGLMVAGLIVSEKS